MKEETDHLSEAYKEEKRKVIMAVLENERLEREIVTQRREIEQQAKEIKKRDSQLDFENKQILVLKMLQDSTEAPQKENTVQGKHQGVENSSGRDKVQLQIDTNGLHNEEKDYELSRQKQTLVDKEHMSDRELQEAHQVSVEVQTDTNGLHNELEEKDYELSRKQTLVEKEHRSYHDLQEAAPKVSNEIISVEDDENSIYVLDDWRLEDCEFIEGEECNSFEDTSPPIPPPESSVDPSNVMQNNNSDLSVIVPDSSLISNDHH